MTEENKVQSRSPSPPPPLEKMQPIETTMFVFGAIGAIVGIGFSDPRFDLTAKAFSWIEFFKQVLGWGCLGLPAGILLAFIDRINGSKSKWALAIKAPATLIGGAMLVMGVPVAINVLARSGSERFACGRHVMGACVGACFGLGIKAVLLAVQYARTRWRESRSTQRAAPAMIYQPKRKIKIKRHAQDGLTPLPGGDNALPANTQTRRLEDFTIAHQGGSSTGLYRDGSCLVVSMADHRFPTRCIKTNLATAEPGSDIAVGRSTSGPDWKPFSLRIPLSTEWLAGQKRQTRSAWLGIKLGIGCLVLAVVFYLIARAHGGLKNDPLWPIFLAGILPGLIGLGALAAVSKPVVTTARMADSHLWLNGVHPEFLATLPEWQSHAETFEESVFEELEKIRNRKSTWVQTAVVLAVSLLLFIGLGMLAYPLAFTVILVGVLLLHELGHYVGMRIFGYRNVRMFFIPFFGAAVSGQSTSVKSYQAAIVTLLGPLPGLCLAVVLFGVASVPGIGPEPRVYLDKASLLLGLVNGFNLLPVFPLDGGRLLNEILFARSRYLEGAFKFLASIALIAYGATQGQWLLCFLGIMILVTVSTTFKISSIAQEIGRQAGDQSSPLDAPIPLPTFQAIVEQVKSRLPGVKTAKGVAGVVFRVWEKTHVQPPGAVATVALLLVYLLAMLLTVPWLLPFFLRSAHG